MVAIRTDNLEAYNLWLKGRHCARQLTATALETGLDYFARALEAEPRYAKAHAGIGEVHAMRANFGFAAPRQVMPLAKEAARRALAIDDRLADAHVTLARVLDLYEWKRSEAKLEYQRALDLNPGDAQARSYYADLLARMGQAEESIAEAGRAVEADPLGSHPRMYLPTALYMARRFETAVTEAPTALRLLPSFYSLYWPLGWALGAQGRYEEAVGAFRRATMLAPDESLAKAYLAWALALDGSRREALGILESLEERRGQTHVSASFIGMAWVGMDECDLAMDWLERAVEERDPPMTYANTWPAFDSLRAAPRFQALLRRMNFPSAGETGQRSR